MIELVPATVAVARAVIDGTDVPVPHLPDWPHEDTADALRGLADHPAHTGEGTFFVVEDGLVVGDCGWFGPPDEGGEVEIGYGLARSARGRGVGTEAVGLLLEWVATRGATRARAEVQPGNSASFALLARLGFVLRERRAGFVVLARDLSHPGGRLPPPGA